MSDFLIPIIPLKVEPERHIQASDYSPRGDRHIEPVRWPQPPEIHVTPASKEVAKAAIAEAIRLAEELSPPAEHPASERGSPASPLMLPEGGLLLPPGSP